MKPWARWIGAAVAILALAAILLAFAGEDPHGSGPSVLSRSGSGWFAAKRYLDDSGARVSLLGRPLAEEQEKPEGALIVAFPEGGFRDREENDAVQQHLRRGQSLLLAFSGEDGGLSERSLFRALNLVQQTVRSDPPLAPARWFRFASETWDLEPEPPSGSVRPVRVRAPRVLPVAPAGSRVFFRGPQGTPVIFEFVRGGGRVLIFPSDALSNGRLGQPGNADLLETLRATFGPALTFDEYRHGFSIARSPTGDSSSAFALDLLLLQLALLYLLAVSALAKRFGTPWKQSPARSGSTAAFFMGVASRHRRLRHFRPAAELLVSRMRQLDPSLSLPKDLDPASVTEEKSFLEFAQRASGLASSHEVSP